LDTNNEYRKLLKTIDYGDTFEPLYEGYKLSARMHVATMEISPDGHYFGGGVYFYRSNDDFSNFFPKYTGLHADIRDICFPDPNNSDLIYVATDGGIGKTTNAGDYWENISGNLALNEIYTFSISEKVPDLLLFGSGDCGITKRAENGNWYHVYGGDGGATLISKQKPDTMLQRGNYGLKYSLNGGINWHSTNLKKVQGFYDQPIIQNPNNPDVFLCSL
ncbi:MAG: hypothetical protein J7K64_09410, partial [Bacteroidales bacterium]|nr:hypothetical protein [Bacteroidales bacterium]